MLKYRTFWRRIIAGLLDYLVFVPVMLAGQWMNSRITDIPILLFAVWHIINSLGWHVYVIYFHGRFGQTLGKMAMKVRVMDVSEDRTIGYGQAFLREIVTVVILLVMVPHDVFQMVKGTYYELTPGSSPDLVRTTLGHVMIVWMVLDVLCMIINRKRRAIHDFIASTVVVRTNVPGPDDPGYEEAIRHERRKGVWITIICIAVLVIILGVFGTTGYFMYKKFMNLDHVKSPEMPVIMNTPGVVTGTNFLQGEVYIANSRLGAITDLKTGAFVEGHEPVLAAVSTGAAAFYDRNGNAVHECVYQGVSAPVKNVTAGWDRDYVFIRQGSWNEKAALMNSQGETMWEYGGMPGVNCMSAGDLDGDGGLDFAVGFNGGGGIHRVDITGKKVWEQSGGNIWHVEITDTTGDGDMRIVHSDAGGRIHVRDGGGRVQQVSNPKPYFSDFSICRWPVSAGRGHCLLAEDDMVWLFDYDGTVVESYAAPGCGTLGHAYGTPFIYEAGRDACLAVIVNFRKWNSTILYVYQPDGKLVYQEVIPESCASILAVPQPSTGQDRLLIGGQGKIYSYTKPDLW